MKTTISSFYTQDSIADKISEEIQIGRSDIDYGNFDDGWPEIKIQDPENNIEGKSVFYLGDINTQDKLFPNIASFQAITGYYAERVNIIIPYFPVGTMERVDKDGQVATAVTMARLFDSTPNAQGAKSTFHFFDIHDLHERFYHNDNVSFKLHTTMDLIKEKIKDIPDLAIGFPDAGAKKRFEQYFEGYETIECIKERKGDNRYIRIKEGEAKGKNIIIVDDLVQSGGTLIKCADALRESGAKSVSAYAPHAVCPNDSHIKLAKNMDKFYTTNSIPDRTEKFKGIDNIEVFDMIELYKKIIEREIGFLK